MTHLPLPVPIARATWRYGVALAAILALGLCWLFAFVQSGHPVVLPNVPEGKVACMSYTPRGIVPGPASHVSAAQIEADLALLAPETRCVRTYSSRLGMEALPAIAGRRGLTVLLGIWIGRDAASNEAEIAAALASARDHPEVIDGIIVGNEVLLRHEQSVGALRKYVARVNAATDEPVTYADVWEFWRTGAALADAVDFVTIHILPYWENEPVGVDAALAHVRDIRAEMQAEFPGKRLVIGETGWPTAGRQREGAKPGRVNGARFVREFIAWADTEGVPYNLIEAFDQPWKRGNEGTVGGYWGLYDATGHPKFPLAGPVVEDPGWWRGLALAGVVAVLGLAAGAFSRHGSSWHAPDWRTKLWLAAVGVTAGALLYAQWRYVLPANRDAGEWLQTGIALACGWLLAIGLAGPLGSALTGTPGKPTGVLIGGVDALRSPVLGAPAPNAESNATSARLLSVLRLALLFGIAYVSLGLALDPRYRDFPLAITALPALLLSLRQLLAPGIDRSGIEERTLASIIALCAIAGAIIEGPANLHALAWNGSCLLLAGAILHGARLQPGQNERREQHPGARRIEPV